MKLKVRFIAAFWRIRTFCSSAVPGADLFVLSTELWWDLLFLLLKDPACFPISSVLIEEARSSRLESAGPKGTDTQTHWWEQNCAGRWGVLSSQVNNHNLGLVADGNRPADSSAVVTNGRFAFWVMINWGEGACLFPTPRSEESLCTGEKCQQ